jgi:hypothetical protein
MANTKGKIIIGAGLFLMGGIGTYIAVTTIRKKKIAKTIYQKLDDKSLQGVGANVSAEDRHKYSLALDPNFWKKSSGSPLPTKLMPDKLARERAKEIYANIGTLWDNESKILSAVKKNVTQGQMSQVAYAYANAPLNYGNLADALQQGLEGGVLVSDKLKELNLYIDSLPY